MGLTKIRAQQISDIDYKQAVRVIATTDVTLSGGAPALVDGVSVLAGDRVLVNGQSTGSQNGLYRVQTVGTGNNGIWVRTTDANETGEIQAGMIVMVTEGDLYKDTQWKLTTNDPIVVGVTALTFVINVLSSVGGANTQIQYNNAGTLAGSANLAWTGTALSIGGNIIPQANITYNLGNTTNRWNDIWLANSSIYLGNAVITANATSLIFTNPEGAEVAISGAASDITADTITAFGNITGNYFLGNGSQLTGIDATSIQNGTANVRTFLNANVTVSAAGTANVLTVTGTGANILGTVNATGNITGANLLINNDAVITGNLTVQGTETIFNVTTLSVEDKDITIANNVTGGANVNGAGILAGNPAVATWLFNNSTTSWQSNVGITPSANGTLDLGGTSNRWGNTWLTTLTVTGNANLGNIGATRSVFTTVVGTLETAAQPNITSVGSLSSLTVTGNVTTGNVSGTLLTGTLTTAAQPNVTSLGNLTSLTVTGNVTGGNLTTVGTVSATGNVSGNFFIGNGSQLTGITTDATSIQNGTSNVRAALNGNVTTSVAGTANVFTVTSAGANVSGTLGVTGNITGSYILGNGAFLSGLNLNFGVESLSFTGDGSTVAFTINSGYNANTVLVFENGVAQEPGTDYTVAGNTLTFTQAPGSGVDIAMRLLNGSSTGGGGGNVDLSAVAQDIIPAANVTYSLGNATNRWANLYLAGNTIDLGGAQLKTDATSGAIALIPAATAEVPNPVAVVISTAGAITPVETTGGELDGNAIANTAANTSDAVIINTTNITGNLTIRANTNAISVGPITQSANTVITIETGQRWIIL